MLHLHWVPFPDNLWCAIFSEWPELPKMPLLCLSSQWSKAGLRVKSCESLWPILFYSESVLHLAQSKAERPYRKQHALSPCTSLLKSQREEESLTTWNWQTLLHLWQGVGQTTNRKLSSSSSCQEITRVSASTYPSSPHTDTRTRAW